ncbi:hypothetical protein ALP58_200038 [Pseudomonas savastanoi]|uniref:Xanthine dehydrogenase n=8 Tax=Pseudomonas syringae group TaxID=136849 RepID=A0A9X0GXI6_PSESX|nr:hypothetical protein PSYMO_29573 [Pseudomonas amygdali pv. mori str. 301020]KPW90023.1 hypothetical protein ALO79_200084 [Pseudomonas syringae pv. castaneae]KPX03140.1 hypothetical protein ALO73_200069 [Pseudomonas syringae pv. daphniphylli]MBL3832835.1 hypothetical protein [Pseudomonas syringae pv. theae]QOI08044.1 hypothetical protein D5S10_30475 [Pseudomonas savastanoi]RMO09467.1 hypothetical protein ALQ46_101984 [Pseudomonas savastanoi pv. phaseolicola]RMO95938.1 hypothetical protein A
MRAIKAIFKFLAILVVASLVARTAIVSGLVQAGLDTSIGNAIDTSLQNFFGINGGEDAEGMKIDIVIVTSLILVTALYWLLSRIISRRLSNK